MDLLFPDLKKRIADYLCARDAIALSKTCKAIHNDLDLKALIDDYSYFRNIKKEHVFRPVDYHGGDKERIWARLSPKVLPNPVHSMVFSCTFHDQGWGNRKGKIFIRKDKNDYNYQGDIVVESGLVDHEETELFLEFCPEPGKKYTLCYVIGGGGGHELYVKDAQVTTLFYYSKGVIEAANILRKKDMIPIRDSKFGISMLLGVIDRLIKDNEMTPYGKQDPEIPDDDALAQSIAATGINPFNNDELEAMKIFLNAWQNFKNPRSTMKRNVRRT